LGDDELDEIENSLRILAQQKNLKVINENGEDCYSLTSKGLRETKKLLKDSENARLTLFSICYNMLLEKQPNRNKHEILTESINFLMKANPNFLEELINAIRDGKIQGLKLKGV
jgi:hypothetical protein